MPLHGKKKSRKALFRVKYPFWKDCPVPCGPSGTIDRGHLLCSYTIFFFFSGSFQNQFLSSLPGNSALVTGSAINVERWSVYFAKLCYYLKYTTMSTFLSKSTVNIIFFKNVSIISFFLDLWYLKKKETMGYYVFGNCRKGYLYALERWESIIKWFISQSRCSKKNRLLMTESFNIMHAV